MIQIRQGVFETNSSSTHAISVCSGADYDALKNGTALINSSLDILPLEAAKLANEKVREEIRNCWTKYGKKEADFTAEDVEEELVDWGGYVSYDELYENSNYEFFTRRTTIGGVDVVAFGYYGYDY